MTSELKTLPDFYVDSIPDIMDTERKELLRFTDINAAAQIIFIWLNQLRIAPYSYDFIDNRCHKSPDYIIENMPALKVNNHFLLAFHVYAFVANSFLVGRFCEPINAPYNISMKSLYIEYRLVENGGKTQLWCKLIGNIKKDLFSKVFFTIFAVVNRIMMSRQLKTIKKLSERSAAGEIEKKMYAFKNNHKESGLHWWIFCRRHNCKGLAT